MCIFHGGLMFVIIVVQKPYMGVDMVKPDKKRSVYAFWYEVGKRFDRDNDDTDNIKKKEDLKNVKI